MALQALTPNGPIDLIGAAALDSWGGDPNHHHDTPFLRLQLALPDAPRDALAVDRRALAATAPGCGTRQGRI